MEGSAIAPPRQVQRQGYLILTIIMGIAGSFLAMAVWAHGTYRVGPLIAEMKVKPPTKGTTERAFDPIPDTPLIKPGSAGPRSFLRRSRAPSNRGRSARRRSR